MDKFIGFTLYAIFNENTDLWWSVGEEDWVFDLQDDCLLPTESLAGEILRSVGETGADIYKIEIPQNERNYSYQKA